jgi:hypothetical protein
MTILPGVAAGEEKLHLIAVEKNSRGKAGQFSEGIFSALSPTPPLSVEQFFQALGRANEETVGEEFHRGLAAQSNDPPKPTAFKVDAGRW